MEATKRRREDTITEETSQGSSELPPEIIREILLRLPAKSIGRLRCVSKKLFRSLSSDQEFAKRHLDLTIHRKLIVSGHNLYALDFGDGSEAIINSVAVELNYPHKEVPSRFDEFIQRIIREDNVVGNELIDLNTEMYLNKWVRFIGYSNGLVCISPCKEAVFLYNPTTGDSKRLPYLSRGGGNTRQTHGYGFDHLTEDYKVVRLAADIRRVHHASVYSLKSDSWRRICDLNYDHDHDDDDGLVDGVNVNGAIHWVFILEEADKRVVLAFDVKTEEFREMQFPGEAAEDFSQSFIAGDLNGRLCVINSCSKKGGGDDDICVMNEYGVASSWTRIRIRFSCRCVRPLCSTNNSDDEVLMVSDLSDKEIVLYNFKTDAWRYLRISGANLSGGFETHKYIESLISPNLYVVEN